MADDAAPLLPLEGYRVLDLGRVIAGPHIGQMLGDMGADVIHVEPPGVGDDSRHIPPFVGDLSANFLISNRNKRSVTLNLKDERGVGMLMDLVKQADILIESNRPGVTKRLGIDYPRLSEVNPRLVVTSISGFGQTGPARHLAGYNQIAQAMGGFMSLTGFPDGPPLRTAAIIGDYLASLYGAFGTLVALIHRDRTGRGQWVDASLYESMVAVLGAAFQEYLSFGTVRRRTGNWAPTMAPSNLYQASDGEVMIVAGNERHWRALCGVMGRPDLADDPEFATGKARVANVERIDELVQKWTSGRGSQEVVGELQKHGIPCATVNDTGMVAEHPQTEARGLIDTIEHPVLGPIRTLGVIPKLSESPGSIRRPPPELGEHNHEVYRDLLGLSAAEIDALSRDGVL